MKSNNRIFNYFEKRFFQIKKKIELFQNNFSTAIFFFFLGFLFGNLFGSLLSIFKEIVFWNGIITIIVLAFMELINYIIYHSPEHVFFGFNLFFEKNLLSRSLNFFKIGLMLGFFVDAFKVGS